MKLKSHALVFRDFKSAWYKKWAAELKQDKDHLDGHMLRANKFWQNAVICQALYKHKKLKPGLKGIGFGVGQERLPAVFAKHQAEVLATDQDYTTDQASKWSEHELATGLKSLNKIAICPPEVFTERVSYRSVDMTHIPKDLNDTYDFLWSNCSLGHLGSITAGLNFIIQSLDCLKPGGVAVHTTEVNTISDTSTVSAGNTVIFRLQDTYRLTRLLINQGYKCSLLKFDLGNTEDDFRISWWPKFGNDYSKIQVGGFVSTQVVLIITKPRTTPPGWLKKWRSWQAKLNYHRNLDRLHNFKKHNPSIHRLIKSWSALPETIKLSPAKKRIVISMKSGQNREIYVEFRNDSPCDLYSYYGHPLNVSPIVLATDGPRDRTSIFASREWVSHNRASSELYACHKDPAYEPIDHVLEGQDFAFKTVLDAKKVKKGTYVESFSILQENLIWINDTQVDVEVNIT
jgi:hypothetical protein